jgi:hypothetical protein
MPREQNDLGIKPIEIRPGAGGMSDFGGMFRRGDPARIPPNRFHSLVNARIEDSEIQSRPGLAKTGGYLDDSCITGIIEIETGGAGGGGIAYHCDEPWQATTNAQAGEYALAASPDWEQATARYWPYGTPRPRQGSSITPGPAIRFRGRTLFVCEPRAPVSTLGSLYDVSYNWDSGRPIADLSLVVDLDEAVNGRVTCWCIRRERLVATGADNDVLYMGTATGRVLRWDGALSVEHQYPTTVPPKPISVILCINTHILMAAGNATTPSAGVWVRPKMAYQREPGGAWVEQDIPDLGGGDGTAVECGVAFDGKGVLVTINKVPDRGQLLAWDPVSDTWSTFGLNPIPIDSPATHPKLPLVVGGALYLFYLATNPAVGDEHTHIGRMTSTVGYSPWEIPLWAAPVTQYPDTTFVDGAIVQDGRLIVLFTRKRWISPGVYGYESVLAAIEVGPTPGATRVIAHWPRSSAVGSYALWAE